MLYRLLCKSVAPCGFADPFGPGERGVHPVDPRMLMPPQMPVHGAQALFPGRRVGFSFNTRVAIRKACDLLGLMPGDEVLAPAYNCGSELDPLLQAGLSVRLYPVDRRLSIDPDAIEPMMGPQTRALYLTHYFGFLRPETQELRRVCDRHGLVLIEDCALSLLSGLPPADGRVGDVAVFCFYKFFPVVQGGALVVNNPAMAHPGFDRPAPFKAIARELARQSIRTALGPLRGHLRRQDRPETGLPPGDLPDMPSHYYFNPDLQNRRMSAITAWQLQHLDPTDAIRRRRQNYLTLRDHIADIPGITVMEHNLPADVCPLGLPILVKTRDAVARALSAKGLASTPWWSGYHRKLDWSQTSDARYLKDHLLLLSVHQDLDTTQMQAQARYLADILHEASNGQTP